MVGVSASCSCTKDQPSSKPPDVPETAPICRTISDLFQWNGQVVMFRCRNSPEVLEHPVGEHNTLITDDFAETYVDMVDEGPAGQTVLTSDRPIKCPGTIRVVGQVDVVDLGGSIGKSAYECPWVRVHRYECD